MHVPPNPAPVRRAGYVEQFDTLLAELSVREMLMYTAELKRPVQARLQAVTPPPIPNLPWGATRRGHVRQQIQSTGRVNAHCTCMPLLQEPMAEKRAQVEHLLEVLGLQVSPRPLVPAIQEQPSAAYVMFMPAAKLVICQCRDARTPTSATCCRAASAAGRRSGPTSASRSSASTVLHDSETQR